MICSSIHEQVSVTLGKRSINRRNELKLYVFCSMYLLKNNVPRTTFSYHDSIAMLCHNPPQLQLFAVCTQTGGTISFVLQYSLCKLSFTLQQRQLSVVPIFFREKSRGRARQGNRRRYSIFWALVNRIPLCIWARRAHTL